MSTQDLTSKMVKGATWMIVARLSDRGMAIISTLVLARLLAPGDFGLVSLAVAILAGLELLGAFSFDIALIQNQKADRSHYDTVWSIQVMFAAFFAASMLALSYPAAGFFNEHRLTTVMQWLAVGVFASGLANVGVVAFRKELDMAKEFKLLFAKRLVLFCVTVFLAFLWRDYWALVAGTVTGMIAGVLISYWMHPYRPRWSLERWRELFSFSRWLFLNNTLGFLYNKAADFIVAKSIDTSSLGYYNLANEISNMPSSELIMPVNRAVFPGYSRMSTEGGALRRGYLNVLSMITLVATPAAVGLGCVAMPMVRLLLGVKWLSIGPLIPVLAIHGLLAAIVTCSQYVLLAAGKPRDVTMLLTARVCLAVPLLAVGVVQWGIMGAAWGLLGSSILLLPVNHYLLSTVLAVKIRDMVAACWRPTVGACCMLGVLEWAKAAIEFGPGNKDQITMLVLLITVGAVVYVATVLGLWWLSKRPDGAEAFLVKRIGARVRAIR
jgi:O-antigen/teichoic acid export membrane protein